MNPVGNEIDKLVNSLKLNPSTFGYVAIEFSSTSSNSKKFCCLRPDWKVAECDQMFEGPLVKYLQPLDTKGKNSIVHEIQIEGKIYIAKAVYLSKWVKYHEGDVFNIKNLKRSLQMKENIYKNCFKPSPVITGYLGMDEYSNELAIASLIKDYLKGSSLEESINTPYTYALCGNWGLYITELANRGDLSNFSTGGGDYFEYKQVPIGEKAYLMVKIDVMIDIIIQVLATLNELLKLGNFLHGDLKARNILIKSETPFNGVYNGMKFGKTGIRAKISDFSNSSITYQTNDGNYVRLFSEVNIGKLISRQLGDFEIDAQLGTSCLAVPIGSPGEEIKTECRTSYWWKLPSKFDNINLLILAHSGMPFYYSIDFYVFMTSLFMIPHIYNSGIEPQIYKIWSSLWKSNELNSVNLDVQKYHEKGGQHGIIDILSILRKYHMRCDAMEFVMSLIKNSQK